MRTEELLQQAQAQAEELQSQQEELRQTNEELEEKTRLLVEQNIEVARKNQEIEQARRALQEKAEQLALTSKYKSEFLASMSHELRTPLNSLLILSQQLSENPEGNLTAQQVEFARTIHGSDTDLLHLIEEAFAKMQAFSRPRVKKLLVVEDDESDRQTILETIENGDVEVTTVSNGTAALAALRAEHFDCMVLDLRLPDISGFQVLEELRKDPRLRDLPVVVNTGKELTPAEEGQLREMAKSIIVKGARSPERLLAETALFLHRVVAHLPAPKRRMLEQLYQSDTALTGKQVLIVDDDVRNIFALTSALERHQMVIHSAENGQEAIERLQTTPGIDIVLMDIMMPDMDGYDTMRAIRALPPFKSLPIIALTAKAMKGDREKCLEAGASDYITKPVNIEQLLSLLRVWLYR
jgi:CheY-like chemotaxis protein